MYHFYTPWKRQKVGYFLTIPGGVEMIHWREMKWVKRNTWNYDFLLTSIIINGCLNWWVCLYICISSNSSCLLIKRLVHVIVANPPRMIIHTSPKSRYGTHHFNISEQIVNIFSLKRIEFVLTLLLCFHAPILVPYLYLAFTKIQNRRKFSPSLTCEVLVEKKFFL